MIDISTLNEAQREAVTAGDGPMLVIAGAGSGKTRTIVYRLAWLAGQGVDPFSMLLLTFTRKSSQEMLNRASRLLDGQLLGVQGGTFHSYAFSVLRRFPPSWMKGSLSIMDTSDSTEAVSSCKEALRLGKGDRSFPKTQAILGLFSKARNKEVDLGDLLSKEAQHLLPHAEGLLELNEAYAKYKREHSLLDYDDLLFAVERLFLEPPEALESQRNRFSRIMVDEYQDTNKVQARIVRLLAGNGGNIMAVGDDAQSIYAFRGATVHNILDFPDLFPGTRIIRLEENYRSVQPVLDVANSLLENTSEGYRKHLFSRRPVSGGRAVTLYRPLSDLTQAQLAARRIEELLATVPYGEIAVLFRSGYQSYHLEVELNRRGIRFRKYGGLRYSEAAHIKDVMAFARLVGNPLDLPSFDRIAALSKGIGPKTSRKLFDLAAAGDGPALEKACRRWPDFLEHLGLISALRMEKASPIEVVGRILEAYRPKLQELFPEDWPRREQGLEELSSMAVQYDDLQTFIADLSLESPEDSEEGGEEPRITLSTVHSAKGLEWSAVLLIDLVEDRFPSRHALVRPEDFEEERRLMYVACTRAKDTLDLFSPLSLYSRSSGGQEPATPSPFVRELPYGMLEEIYENYGGGTARRRAAPEPSFGAGRSFG
ncbi:MAG: ATP-dependent helicase, partial [Mailhella sp.]|nr:ATP-dependent helicase [Mailhella sp.]